MFGTGLRGFTESVAATIDGEAVAVAGPFLQGTFAGLDQFNLGAVSRDLAGRGTVVILLVVDGIAANPVEVVFR